MSSCLGTSISPWVTAPSATLPNALKDVRSLINACGDCVSTTPHTAIASVTLCSKQRMMLRVAPSRTALISLSESNSSSALLKKALAASWLVALTAFMVKNQMRHKTAGPHRPSHTPYPSITTRGSVPFWYTANRMSVMTLVVKPFPFSPMIIYV